jgi:signal peptidase II
VVLDQLSKLVVLRYLPGIVVINSRFAFSLGPSVSGVVIIVIILTLLALFLTKYYKKSKNLENILVVVVASGGLSNAVDRITQGGVVDFIRLGSFPVFNLADALISMGLIYLIIETLWPRQRKNSV